MTNTLEQNRNIIADAPEGASHIEESSSLFIKVTENDNLPFFNTWWIYEDGSWVENDSYNILLMRKIDDIRENIALQERIVELESTLTVTNKFLHQFTEVCRTGSIKVEGFKAQDKLDNMFREYVAGLDSIQKSETAKEVNNECN